MIGVRWTLRLIGFFSLVRWYCETPAGERGWFHFFGAWFGIALLCEIVEYFREEQRIARLSPDFKAGAR